MRRGINSLLCRAGLIAVGLAGAALLVPGTAGAVLPNPACGSTVYKSVKLHSNMNCSMSDTDGLIVGRSGITINLNGFELMGPRSVFMTPAGMYAGIYNAGGFNGVTVTNGSVEDYYEGVYFDGTKNANISNVSAEHNSFGIAVEDSTNGTVTDSAADDNFPAGVYLYQNHMVTVSNSDASDNGLGIYDYGSLDTIDADTMNDNVPPIAMGPNATKNRGARLKGGPLIGKLLPRGDGLFVDYPLTVSSSSGQLYYTIEHSSADNNYSDGFHIAGNSPTTLYQAKVFDNAATFNGTSGSGFGFYAYQQVKGYGNGVRGNASGNCYHVPCHTIP